MKEWVKMGRDNKDRRKKKRIVCWAVLFTLFFISTHSVCSADPDDRDIVIVFDASGSMEELTDSGETKIDAAKEAVIEYLNGLTSDDRVALIVFYDCQDIEVEADFTYDHRLVSARVSSITTQGDTPIRDSLLAAWDYLKVNGNINHSWYIVIFTDGGETCNYFYDPCEVAERIASESSSYRQTPVYTIGFMIEGSQAEEDLTCIADTTGGEYFSADSPEELKEAFEKIDSGITINEVIVYSVASTAVLGSLLVARSLFYKHARGRGHRPRERTEHEEEDYFTEQPMKEEMTILWGAAEEERDDEDYYPGEPVGGEPSIIWEDEEQEEYTGEEFVDW